MFGKFCFSFLIVVFAIVFSAQSQAQNTSYIWNPQLSYSWKSSDRMAYNAKIVLFNSISEEQSEDIVQFAESQLSFAYSSTTRLKLGVGYYYRLSTPFIDGYQYEHRFLQQAGLLTFIGDRRISHRFRNEFRFRDSSFQLRIRYRISYDFPLRGQQLDAGEPYLILKNEILGAFTDNTSNGENRISIGQGWLLNRKQKIELGLEYRTRNIFDDRGISHQFLFTSTYFYNR